MVDLVRISDLSGNAKVYDVPKPNDIMDIAFAGGVDGTVTGGTLTVLVQFPSSTNFETPTVNTIDLSAPEKLQIDGPFSKVEISVATFAGTATELDLSLRGRKA